ncbi:acyl carrier protein [Negadavirga shengliensis]|uniref:Acyl carrier protein n=1 Tax=Negadavirga shengliensis TaxID=1389218 RepID=A0ABV9T384_9BACT
MIEVFRLYGIQTIGKKKFASFYSDLKMDKIYVQGLIYELELTVNRQISDTQAATVESPAQLIEILVPMN